MISEVTRVSHVPRDMRTMVNECSASGQCWSDIATHWLPKGEAARSAAVSIDITRRPSRISASGACCAPARPRAASTRSSSIIYIHRCCLDTEYSGLCSASVSNRVRARSEVRGPRGPSSEDSDAAIQVSRERARSVRHGPPAQPAESIRQALSRRGDVSTRRGRAPARRPP